MLGLFLTRDMYRCARNSNWGDLLPFIQQVDDDLQTDSD